MIGAEAVVVVAAEVVEEAAGAVEAVVDPAEVDLATDLWIGLEAAGDAVAAAGATDETAGTVAGASGAAEDATTSAALKMTSPGRTYAKFAGTLFNLHLSRKTFIYPTPIRRDALQPK